MPDEYIKRDTAINEAICAVYWALNQHGNVTGQVIINRFNAIPIADVVEVRHGKWEVFDEPDTNAYECTACHDVFWLSDGTPFENNYYFCPNCGADMRSGNNE